MEKLIERISRYTVLLGLSLASSLFVIYLTICFIVFVRDLIVE